VDINGRIQNEYFLLSDNIKGYEEIINKKYTGFMTNIENAQDSLYNKFVIKTNRSIDNLILKYFDSKEIRQIIKEVTSEKVDSFSIQYLDDLIEKKITPKLKSIVTELDNSEAKIQFIEFYLSKVSVLNDDRYSFEKLIEISSDKNNSYSNQAIDLVNTIIMRYSLPSVPSRRGLIITARTKDFIGHLKIVITLSLLIRKNEG
jgi:hypothetical protein